jgi:cytochrome b involved in lipid metabolism
MLTGRSGRTSTLPGLKTPANRNAVNKSTAQWLKDRRDDDGAEGLWRIHDNLYDFSSFVETHPGGQEWLQLTKVQHDLKIKMKCSYTFL